MNDVKIPYAYVDDTISFVLPHQAQKWQNFRCPDCDGDLILRKGEIRVPHFAHRADTACTGEGVIHKIAKLILYSIYYTSFNRLNKCVVALRRKCPGCSMIAYVKHPDSFCDRAFVKAEYRFEGLIIDVLIGEQIDSETFSHALGIEVYSHNRVSDKKWKTLRNLNIPCIEVKAQDVIDEWNRGGFLYGDNRWFLLKPIRQNIYIHNNPEDEGVVGRMLPEIDCPRCKSII